jgi:surface carbohydrate biosynthesis protein
MKQIQHPNKWLILPIETKVRELDGKILLAAMAAKRGWGVLLGYKNSILEDSKDVDGIVLEKDGAAANKRIGRFVYSGRQLCIMDEEGLVYQNSQDYYRRKLDAENYMKADLVFLWGSVQHKDVSNHLQIAEGKLIETGNPRFDLLRPEFRQYYAHESDLLKAKYGRFILINTNFGESNHFMGTEWLLDKHRRNGFISSPQDEAKELAYIEYQARISRSFCGMIPKIIERFPHHKVIVRPHPSENHRTWTSWARGIKNISVVHEGDVNAWMLAADLSIHNSCMTGVQAFLLERPVITYMPVESEQFDFYLPNALSIKTASPGEVISAMEKILFDQDFPGYADRQKKMLITEQYISAIDESFASERILDALENLQMINNFNSDHPLSGKNGNRRFTPFSSRLMKEFFRKMKTRISEFWASEIQKNQADYARQKFSGISMREVRERFIRLQYLNPRFTQIRLFQLGLDSFIFLPE